MLAILNRQHELRGHVRGAINNGVTREEIREIFLHVGLYAGAPVMLDSVRIAKEVLAEMEKYLRSHSGAPRSGEPGIPYHETSRICTGSARHRTNCVYGFRAPAFGRPRNDRASQPEQAPAPLPPHAASPARRGSASTPRQGTPPCRRCCAG
jgi:hypothetical protein